MSETYLSLPHQPGNSARRGTAGAFEDGFQLLCGRFQQVRETELGRMRHAALNLQPLPVEGKLRLMEVVADKEKVRWRDGSLDGLQGE